jgi:predicted acetyltransferase
MFPTPPPRLTHGEVELRFVQMLPGDAVHGLVPGYHFRIHDASGTAVGFINLRVGNTDHVRLYAGHIGYGIEAPHRGRHYALQACRALAAFVRTLAAEVIITCDPDNAPSRRTIEALGAAFLEEVPVPPHDPHYRQGSRAKRRYLWTPL